MGDGRNRKEHRRGIPVERPLANPLEGHETITLIESDCLRFCIGHDSDATEPITLIECQPKDMPEQRTSYTAALRSSVDTEPGETEHRQRIPRKAASQPGRREMSTFQARRSHGGEANNPAGCCRHIRDGQMQLELVLSGVVLEEAINLWRDEAHWAPGVSGWYRFRLAEQPPDEPYAVYLYQFSMNAAVYLNEELVGSGGSFDEPVARNWNRPLLFSLPRSAWRDGDNYLYVRLRVYPGFGHLAPPAIGPSELFVDAYRSRFTVQITFAQIAFLVALLSAGFGVAFWLVDRSSSMYLYFALCGATWSIYSLNLFVQNLPVPAGVWWWLVHTCIDVFAVSLVLFAHRLLGIRRPRIERSLWLFALGAALVYAVAGIPGIARLNPLVHLGDLLCGIYLVGFLMVELVRRRSVDAYVLTGSILVMLGLTIHDQFLNALIAPDAWATRYYLLQFASPLMLLVMMIHLTRRFRIALNESRRTTQDLQRRVTEATRALERSYEQNRLMDQERAAVRERERIYQDLHDEIGGTLLSLVYAPSDDRSRQLARDAIGELRSIVASDPAQSCTLEEFSADMRQETEERLAAAGLALTWDCDAGEGSPMLSGAQRYELHRILREIVTNTIRHAAASCLTVSLRARGPEIRVAAANDGQPLPAEPEPGRGLAGIRKRTARLGGRCPWHNEPDAGVTFELTLPATPERGVAPDPAAS
jgi:signal transduction histidine kinase